MLISIDSFQGMQPRIEPHLLQPNMAKVARNANLQKGSLRPWKKELINTTLSQSDTLIKTIYRYLETYWFEFTAEVHILPGPIANDTTSRRYFTGIGIPKKTNEAEATTGSPPYPVNYYPMGAPIPHKALTAALGGGGTGDPRTIGYEWTLVTSWGEQGPPSPVSNLVSALQGQTVNLSGITIKWAASQTYETGMYIVPSGGVVDHVYFCVVGGVSAGAEPTWGTTVDGDTTDNTVTWRAYKKAILFDSGATKRVYRILTGDAFGSYHFVGAVAMASEVYVDSKTDTEAAGGVIIPSGDWYPPPVNMQGLTSIGRFMAGFVGKDLFFCEPNYPHAYPSKYSFPLDFPIVAMGAVGNSLVVGTEQNPYIVQGSNPGVMTPVRFADSHPCVSSRGLVAFENGIAFPSNDGLYFVGGGKRGVITKGAYTTKDWAAYHPETFIGAYHDGRYFAFYDDGAGDSGAIVVNMENGSVSEIELDSTALFVDPKTDVLFFNIQETI
jgi:hypothetical protein